MCLAPSVSSNIRVSFDFWLCQCIVFLWLRIRSSMYILSPLYQFCYRLKISYEIFNISSISFIIQILWYYTRIQITSVVIFKILFKSVLCLDVSTSHVSKHLTLWKIKVICMTQYTNMHFVTGRESNAFPFEKPVS